MKRKFFSLEKSNQTATLNIYGDITSFPWVEGDVSAVNLSKQLAFSNKTYDFSKINGELYWEERPLEYIFEILADTPEKLEEKKQK